MDDKDVKDLLVLDEVHNERRNASQLHGQHRQGLEDNEGDEEGGGSGNRGSQQTRNLGGILDSHLQVSCRTWSLEEKACYIGSKR